MAFALTIFDESINNLHLYEIESTSSFNLLFLPKLLKPDNPPSARYPADAVAVFVKTPCGRRK
jgi:hypothetical protein